MLFSAIEAVLPSRKVTNDDIVEAVLACNRAALDCRAQAQLARALQLLFSVAGTQTRYVRERGETAVDLTCRVGRAALQSAGLDGDDIDLLMWVGVGRGFLEPATANVFQDRLGLRRATCFDVLDACASWLRAIHIARAFLRLGEYRRIMILNGEFNVAEYVNFQFEGVRDLSHNFASFTIGEAATATILTATDADSDYYATFRTWGQLRDLCMIPLPNVSEFNGGPLPGHATSLRFFSNSRALFEAGIENLVAHFRQDIGMHGYIPDIAFGHAASDSAYARVASECEAPQDCYYYTHARFGNTVSAAVPLAMAHAIKEGRLKDNHKVVIGMASAGLSTAWMRFRYMNHSQSRSCSSA